MLTKVPRTFIPDEKPDRTLIEVIYEKGDGYEILWYHWPKDGVFWWEDYEPLILIYDENGALCLVSVRRGWRFQQYEANEVAQSMELLFDTTQHHPFVKTTYGSRSFDVKKTELVEVTPQIRALQIGELPEIVISGIRPFLNNIYIKIEQMKRDYCS